MQILPVHLFHGMEKLLPPAHDEPYSVQLLCRAGIELAVEKEKTDGSLRFYRVFS